MSTRTPGVKLEDSAGLALGLTLLLLVAGGVAWMWTGEWKYAVTGLLFALVAFCAAAWFNARKS